MKHLTLTIPKINCISCYGTIKDSLNEHFPELEIEAFNDPKKIFLTISLPKNSQITLHDIKLQLMNIGYPVKETDQTNQQKLIDSTTALKQKEFLYKFIASAVLGIPLLMLSAFGITLPFYALISVAVMSFSVMIYAGLDIFKKGLYGFYNSGKPNMDTLFSISTLVAFSVSLAAFFIPTLPFEFASALLIFSSRYLGKYIESTMKEKVGQRPEFRTKLPKIVQRVTLSGVKGIQSIKEIYSSEIQIGDILLINKDGYLPVDGKLKSKEALLYNTFRNGSLEEELAIEGSDVFAGTRVSRDGLYFEVTHLLEDSYLTRWEKRLTESLDKTSVTKIEAFTERLARYFVPAVLVVSILTVAIALPLYGPMVALHSALSILVGACPCTLGFITPLAMSVGINKSAKHGASIYDRETLEKGANIKTVIMDLNGTLTEAKSNVEAYELYETNTHIVAIKKIILALEKKVRKANLIGKCLRDFAQNELKEEDVNSLPEINDFEERTFSGIKGSIGFDTYHLGNETLLNTLDIQIQNSQPNRQYLIKNNKIIAHFNIKAPLRKDATQTINALKNQGIKVVLLSGASEKTVKAFAKELSINEDDCFYNCLGDEKAGIIKKLQKEGLVAMVGDAINDAIALNTADIGIAVENAEEHSKWAANVIINNEGLQPIIHFFKNAKDTMAILKQNLVFSLAYNAVVMVFTMSLSLSLGSMAPTVMALSMGLQSLLIIANTYRLSKLSPTLPENEISVEKLIPSHEENISLEATPDKKPFKKNIPFFPFCCFFNASPPKSLKVNQGIEQADSSNKIFAPILKPL